MKALAAEVKTMFDTTISKIDSVSKTLVRSTPENRVITEAAVLIFGFKIEEKKLPTSLRIVYPDGRDILDKLRGMSSFLPAGSCFPDRVNNLSFLSLSKTDRILQGRIRSSYEKWDRGTLWWLGLEMEENRPG